MQQIFDRPFDSWTLNAKTGLWEPPIEVPKDNRYYEWDERSFSWIWLEHTLVI